MTRLEAYRRISGASYEKLAKHLGRTGVQTQRYCKSLGDARHSQPGPDVAVQLKQLTFGVIDLGNYADEITPAEAAEMMAEIARREAEAQAQQEGEAANG